MTRKEYKIQYKQLKTYFKMQKNELLIPQSANQLQRQKRCCYVRETGQTPILKNNQV